MRKNVLVIGLEATGTELCSEASKIFAENAQQTSVVFAQVESELAALDQPVEELLQQGEQIENPSVLLVAELGSVVGTELLFDTAHYLQYRLGRRKPEITGFLLLPEVLRSRRVLHEAKEKQDRIAAETIRRLQLSNSDDANPENQTEAVLPALFERIFLYGRCNSNGMVLRGKEEYLAHVANTIITWVLSEQGSLANDCDEKHKRAIFCGAGSSLLCYPQESALQYVTDRWICEQIGDKLLSVDRAYDQYRQRATENNVDIAEPGLTRQDAYFVRRVEAGEGENRDAELLPAPEHEHIEELTEQLRRWLQQKLGEAEVVQEAELNYAALRVQLQHWLNADGRKNREYDEKLRSGFLELEKLNFEYQEASLRCAEELKDQWIAENCGGNVFGLAAKLFCVEQGGLQPNEVRYRLCRQLRATARYLNAHERDAREILSTERLCTDRYLETKQQIMMGGHRAFKGDLAEVFLDELHCVHTMAMQCATERQLPAICEAILPRLKEWEYGLYDLRTALGELVEDAKKEADGLRRRFRNRSGTGVHYICADEQCFDALYDHFKEKTGYIWSKLGDRLLQQVLSTNGQPEGRERLRAYCLQELRGILAGAICEAAPERMHMDILSAAVFEAECRCGAGLTVEQMTNTVEELLHIAERLALPFIDEPLDQWLERNTVFLYHQGESSDENLERQPLEEALFSERRNVIRSEALPSCEMRVFRGVYNIRIAGFGSQPV